VVVAVNRADWLWRAALGTAAMSAAVGAGLVIGWLTWWAVQAVIR
jgi:hypothetical protein